MTFRGNRALYAILACVAASVASAADVRGVINTKGMQFTGVAAGSAQGRIMLRTPTMEFTGTAGSGASR